MPQNKLLQLTSFILILIDLAMISIIIFSQFQNETPQLIVIILIVGYGISVTIQQLSIYIDCTQKTKYLLNFISFFSKIIIIWVSELRLLATQNLIILFEIYLIQEQYSFRLLQKGFGFMFFINIFPLKQIQLFQYDLLICLVQFLIFIFQRLYLQKLQKINQPQEKQYQPSFTQISTDRMNQPTFAAIQESRKSVPIIINTQKINDDNEPWLEQKWLFYEKYLVLDHDLKLKYYSYYPNLISGSQIQEENEIIDLLLEQKITFVSKLDNSQQSNQQQKAVTLKIVLEHQNQFFNEHYYQSFYMFSQTFDVSKFLINVFTLMGVNKIFYVLHFQVVPKQTIEINTNVFDMCKSLSHELGTNLNCIQNLSEIALQNQSIQREIKDNLIHPILTNSQQLNLIISNIRDYSSIETDQFQLSLSTFILQQEIQFIADFFQLTCQEKGLLLELPYGNYTIFNDRDRFRQVIFQLLSNAIRFTSSGTISIRINQKDINYEIQIEDTGIGMNFQEEINLRKILEQKIMLRVSENSIGSSLGLFISNLLVKKMNADDDSLINFVTTNGIGSTFYFEIKNMAEAKESLMKMFSNRQKATIVKFSRINSYYENLTDPYKIRQNTYKSIQSAQSNQDDANLTVYSREFDENKTALQPIQSLIPQLQDTIQQYSLKSNCCSRVLIVDDEYFNLMALELLMQQYQSKCDKSYNGMEALEKINFKLKNSCKKCQNNCYQLIFLDINMPIMGGIETVRVIKKMVQNKIIKKVFVIANTGFSDLETKEKAYDAGIDYFMTKPLNLMNFRTLVQTLFPME